MLEFAFDTGTARIDSLMWSILADEYWQKLPRGQTPGSDPSAKSQKCEQRGQTPGKNRVSLSTISDTAVPTSTPAATSRG